MMHIWAEQVCVYFTSLPEPAFKLGTMHLKKSAVLNIAEVGFERLGRNEKVIIGQLFKFRSVLHIKLLYDSRSHITSFYDILGSLKD